MESGIICESLNTPSPGIARWDDVPFAIASDVAFPLRPYFVRPLPRTEPQSPKRVFNYRLSRARMAVENAFVILVSRSGALIHRP